MLPIQTNHFGYLSIVILSSIISFHFSFILAIKFFLVRLVAVVVVELGNINLGNMKFFCGVYCWAKVMIFFLMFCLIPYWNPKKRVSNGCDEEEEKKIW